MRLSQLQGSNAAAAAGVPEGAAAAVREFYRDVLRGRQVWPTERADGSRSLWFLVGGTLVDVAPDLQRDEPIVLHVDDPEGLAARCWDAGFSVHVPQDPPHGGRLRVLDPLGREVELAPRGVTITTMRTRRWHRAPREQQR